VDKPVIGLQMDVDYLTRVREERVRALGLDRLLYKAEKEVVKEELDFAQRVYDKLGCQVIDVTGLSSRDLVNAIMSQIKKKREEMR
jgi:regulator of PEP synthase PpsR (kinase-PPPase family)